MTATSRYAWADAAKGCLILFVVAWHIIMKNYLQMYWDLPLPLPALWGLAGNLMWQMMMPLFLLLSGFFAGGALTRPWPEVARTRVARFGYLYLLWTLIHMATMWPFRDFDTLVPRSVGQFVQYLTISPPNTWYLYALAGYFLVAKTLSPLPPWLQIGAAAVLSVSVSAGWIPLEGNRGSLLGSFVYFLVGLHLRPQITKLVERSGWVLASTLTGGFLAAFAAMSVIGARRVPGVWVAVTVAGVTAGLAVSPVLARLPAIGRSLVWLGQRTLPIYVIHLPIVALFDWTFRDRIAAAGSSVQLVAAATWPAALTVAVVAACLFIHRWLVADGLRWLFDLPFGLGGTQREVSSVGSR